MKEINGNIKKFYSYKEAKKRITKAIKCECFFEAIAIEESIISDRVLSFLLGQGYIKVKDDEFVSLNKLLNVMKSSTKQPIMQDSYENLSMSLMNWKNNRNNCLHGIAKSYPGTPTMDICNFLDLAKTTAIEGEKLCVAVDKWNRRMKVGKKVI